MSLDDLKITCDLAKQILDLYSDILLLQQNDNSRYSQTFQLQVKQSNAHRLIMDKFGPYSDLIKKSDGGESISRFQ